ncbi:FecR domain-containing protein [Mucilaginibacter sp. HMF5004]|uniref:FecR family protein n=1 Tax=Mucilaginibacter rivuli TaxID=2857527 RepID=UPI001C601400|nr:FecR domain-containing protein [Mucilaginibacter rivuli]MBW4889138.1 FecR domain-containing protein [Mucilaginibacter rivuli]
MNYPVTPQLLHKYIDGNCTDEEVRMLYRWYDDFEDSEDPLDTLSDEEQQVLKMLMLNKFKASVVLPVHTSDDNKTERHFSMRAVYWLSGIAAMVFVVLGVYFNKKTNTDNLNAIITTASEQMMLNNQTNSIYKQVLSDGSVVWLSPKSQLEYPKKFMGKYRQIEMHGEAFFEVSKDHAHPFVIYSGGVITKVWGTSFRIRAYKNVPTEVSVVTGKVSVKLPENDKSEVMLFPTQKIVYSRNRGALTRAKEAGISGMRIWQKASVSFDDVPLDSVLTVLNSHFGTRIYTNDKELGKYLLKADFTDQNLPAILDMLESSLNVGYNMDDTEMELYRKPKTN